MPNTKSAERRMRNSSRKAAHNQAIKSNLKTVVKKYNVLAKAGSKTEAADALRAATSALDKAVKSGVVKKSTVNRKKSRLALALNKVAAQAAK